MPERETWWPNASTSGFASRPWSKRVMVTGRPCRVSSGAFWVIV